MRCKLAYFCNPEGKNMRMLIILFSLQVIRFIDSSGSDIIPRKDRVWTTDAVASRMIDALIAANRPVPEYLEDLPRGNM